MAQSGSKCAQQWSAWMLDPTNEYACDYGHTGDQGYLMLFIPLFGRENVHILEDIGHLAPWNLKNHNYELDHIIWNGERQKLNYYHFSNFLPLYDKNSYVPAPRHGDLSPLLLRYPLLKQVASS